MKNSASVLEELRQCIDERRVSVKAEDLAHHSRDKSFHEAVEPDFVVWPETALEVSRVLKLASRHQIPVTAWGGGSSLEGNPIPTHKGIVLDMSHMNKLVTVFADDLEARVEPGIIGTALDELLKPYGLWFASAPGSKHLATIGGMIANNAGGMFAVKYGVVKDSVLALEVVLANGNVIKVGSRSFKTVSGYDLKDLFVGSEGTLGVITQAVIKLTPLPADKSAVLVSFNSESDAAHASLDLLKSSIRPASLEYMDATYVGLVNAAKNVCLPKLPTLLIELHGDKATNTSLLKSIQSICKNNGMAGLECFTGEPELEKLWEYRRAVRPAITKLMPNSGVLSAEVGVPVSHIPELLAKAKAVSQKYGLQTVMFGHMGDGNFHCWALYELHNEDSLKKVHRLNEDLVHFAIAVGGTTTGEHGLGIGKRKFLKKEHPTSLNLMKDIKELLDPRHILNPGKMFDDD